MKGFRLTHFFIDKVYIFIDYIKYLFDEIHLFLGLTRVELVPVKYYIPR